MHTALIKAAEAVFPFSVGVSLLVVAALGWFQLGPLDPHAPNETGRRARNRGHRDVLEHGSPADRNDVLSLIKR